MDLANDQAGNRISWSLRLVGLAGIGLPFVREPVEAHKLLQRRRAGKIIVQEGRLVGIAGRWWPHLGSLAEVWLAKRARFGTKDRCELYYHQPLGSAGFLTLSYVKAGPATSLSTFYASTLVLDEIARLKDTQAVVCHVTNDRLSDRLLRRWGWQQHCLQWSGRHFIKRFYGHFPEIAPTWRKRLRLGDAVLGAGQTESAEVTKLLRHPEGVQLTFGSRAIAPTDSCATR